MEARTQRNMKIVQVKFDLNLVIMYDIYLIEYFNVFFCIYRRRL